MAKDDYIVDLGTSEVSFKGYLVARFNGDTREITEFFADGKNRTRWIKGAIDNAPKEADLRDSEEIGWEEVEAIVLHEEDFYKSFPAAPRPYQNPVGYKHIEVFEWIKKHYEDHLEHLYPTGPWSEVAAGLKGRVTIRNEKDIEIEYLN